MKKDLEEKKLFLVNFLLLEYRNEQIFCFYGYLVVVFSKNVKKIVFKEKKILLQIEGDFEIKNVIIKILREHYVSVEN